MELIGKHEIELNLPGDGRKFLNYWAWANGKDVCCEIKDGELFRTDFDDDGNELPQTKITFADFLGLVEKSILAINLK